MSLLLQDILEYLVDNELCEAVGTDAFMDKRPDQPDTCFTIYEYEGMAEAPYETVATHRSVQLTYRAPTAAEAKVGITKAHNLIRSSLDETGVIYFNGRFTQTSIRQTPFKLLEDSNARVVYGFNMGITTEEDS